jgi:hypothetical protein
MGRALELGLKAYLVHRGVPLKDLGNSWKFSHNLEACLAEAERLGLSGHVAIRDQDRDIVRVVNAVYKPKFLEYFVRGPTTRPQYGFLQETTLRILDAVVAVVPDAHFHLNTKAGQVFSSFHRGGPKASS